MALTQRTGEASQQRLIHVALIIAALGLLLGLVAVYRSFDTHGGARASAEETALARIKRTGVMRVGYGGFPPYTIVDPAQTDPNKRVSGLAVDMVNAIAARHSPALKVEWVNLNWDTFRADMESNRFDFLADAVYATVPKAADFGMTEPFSYFGLAVAVVRIDDNRFATFADLDRPDITIALAQGYASTEFAQRELTRPKFKMIPVGKDAFSQLDEVLLGRADVALNDVPTVLQYVRAHPTKVKALWIERPPSWVEASFVTRQRDADLREFLNVSIRILAVDGTLGQLDRKWGGLGYYEKRVFEPGAGLRRPPER